MHYSGTDGGNNVCKQFGDVCWLWQQLLQYSLSGKLLVSISLTHIFHNAPLERRCVTTVGKEHNLCTVCCKKAAISIIFGLCIPAKSSSGSLAQLENKHVTSECCRYYELVWVKSLSPFDICSFNCTHYSIVLQYWMNCWGQFACPLYRIARCHFQMMKTRAGETFAFELPALSVRSFQ